MKDLSTGDLAELRQSFDTCDANGDGWIIVNEFSALLLIKHAVSGTHDHLAILHGIPR